MRFGRAVLWADADHPAFIARTPAPKPVKNDRRLDLKAYLLFAHPILADRRRSADVTAPNVGAHGVAWTRERIAVTPAAPRFDDDDVVDGEREALRFPLFAVSTSPFARTTEIRFGKPAFPPASPHGAHCVRSMCALNCIGARARKRNSTPKPPRYRPAPPESVRSPFFSIMTGIFASIASAMKLCVSPSLRQIVALIPSLLYFAPHPPPGKQTGR